MIVATGRTPDGRRKVLIGLSRENVERMTAGSPVKFDLNNMGVADAEVFIFSGETEDDMARQLGIDPSVPSGKPS